MGAYGISTICGKYLSGELSYTAAMDELLDNNLAAGMTQAREYLAAALGAAEDVDRIKEQRRYNIGKRFKR